MPREGLLVLLECMRKVFCSYPCRLVDIELVEDRAFFHCPKTFLVIRRSREIHEQYHRTEWLSSHIIRNSPHNFFDLDGRAIRQVNQENLFPLMADGLDWLMPGETLPSVAFALLAFGAAFEALVAIVARSFPVRALRASLHDGRIKFSLRLWIVGPVTGEHFIFVNCPHFIPGNVYVHVFVAHNRRAMWNYDGPVLRHRHRHAGQYR